MKKLIFLCALYAILFAGCAAQPALFENTTPPSAATPAAAITDPPPASLPSPAVMTYDEYFSEERPWVALDNQREEINKRYHDNEDFDCLNSIFQFTHFGVHYYVNTFTGRHEATWLTVNEEFCSSLMNMASTGNNGPIQVIQFPWCMIIIMIMSATQMMWI